MLENTINRGNPLIDPDLHVWHGEVAADLFLAGTVAGLMILTALFRLLRSPEEPSRALRLMPWLSPVLISVCLLFLWLDLANRLNAFRFYLVFRLATPMSWGAWILLSVYPASALFAWSELPDDLRERLLRRLPWLRGLGAWAEARARGLAAANLLLGIALGLYTGVVLSIYSARPLWHSPLLPLLFLSSGLACGASCLLMARTADQERERLGRCNLGFLGAQALILALWLIDLRTGGQSTQQAAHLLLGGGYTAAFWALPVALGIAAPAYGEWMTGRRGRVPGRAGAFLVLAGAFALRWILVYAGQHAGGPAVH